MKAVEKIEGKGLNNSGSEEKAKIEVKVEKYPVARPKFTKEDWDSGEGSGQGEG